MEFIQVRRTDKSAIYGHARTIGATVGRRRLQLVSHPWYIADALTCTVRNDMFFFHFSHSGYEVNGDDVADQAAGSRCGFCANMRRVAYASCRVAASGVGAGESRIRVVRRPARNCGIDRQTVRDWVHRYNEQGIDGLSNRPHGGGAPAKLTVEEKTQRGLVSAMVRILLKTAWFAGGGLGAPGAECGAPQGGALAADGPPRLNKSSIAPPRVASNHKRVSA
jgi:hypothetical protein